MLSQFKKKKTNPNCRILKTVKKFLFIPQEFKLALRPEENLISLSEFHELY